jgi:hypothetical protein
MYGGINLATGGDNTSVGTNSMQSHTSGYSNVAVGMESLNKNTSGAENTAVGKSALFSNTSNAENTAVGASALYYNTGLKNTAVGKSALLNTSTGGLNTALGHAAGDLLTTGAQNVIVGAGADPSSNAATNQIVIGYNAVGAGDNTVQLGNTSVTNVNTSGTVTAGGFIKSGGTASQFLMANGSTTSSPSLSSATSLPLTTGVTGTLPVANGGTGVTSSTGTGSVALSGSPTFTGTSTFVTHSSNNSINVLGNSANASTINFYDASGGTRYGFVYADNAGQQIGSYSTLPLLFMTGGLSGSPIERMRIDHSSGNVGIGLTNPGVPLEISTSGSTGLRINSTSSDNNGIITLNANTNSNFSSNWHEFMSFQKQGTTIGAISSNGPSNVSFATSSDFRLKKDFRDFDAIELISKMKVYDYAWKSDNSRMFGFIAHELQTVVPYLVTGERDAIDDLGKPRYQMVDYGKVTPILVKALQEQHEIISSQQRRIEDLEKKVQILLDQKR